MDVLIISLILVIALLLILVVLAQNSKGGGISSEFGGSSTSQVMGVKKTGDLLEKITWSLAIGLLALSLLSSIFADTNNQKDATSILDNEELQQQEAPQLPIGSQPAEGGNQNMEEGETAEELLAPEEAE